MTRLAALLVLMPLAAFAIGPGEAPSSLVASSPKGDIYVVYDRSDAVTEHLVVEKLSIRGGLLWRQVYSAGLKRLSAQAAAADSAGNLWVTGLMLGDSPRSFLLKYSPEGALLFLRTVDDWKENTVYLLATDSEGDAYLAGGVRGRDLDVLVQKWSPAGEKLWEKTFDSGFNDYARSLSVDFEGGHASVRVEKAGEKEDRPFAAVTVRYNRTGGQSYK